MGQSTRNRNYLVVIVVLIIIILLSLKSCQDQKDLVQSKMNLLSLNDSSYQKSQRIWKDKLGKEHITITQLQLEKEDLIKYTKDLAKQLKIKPKNINSVTSLTTSTDLDKKLQVDTVEKIVVIDSSHIDTLRQFDFKYEDKWASVEGCIGDSINCKDSISINLTDSFTIVTYVKKKWFKDDIRYIDISNSNPYVHMNSIKSLEMKQKKPKVAIGLSMGVGYSTSNIINKNPYPQLQFGISIIYLPLSIKIH